jgi:hypothetical protein
MDGEQHRATRRSFSPEKFRSLARLAKVEPIEGLIEKEKRSGHEQSERQQESFALALRERANSLVAYIAQFELVDQLRAYVDRCTIQPLKESKQPIDALVGPRRDRIRQIKEVVLGVRFSDLRAALIRYLQSGDTLEQRRFPRPVRADDPKHFARAYAEGDASERTRATERLRKRAHLEDVPGFRQWSFKRAGVIS